MIHVSKTPAIGSPGLKEHSAPKSKRNSNMVTALHARDKVPPLHFGAPPPRQMLVSEGRQTIGPELAERILAETNYSRQREVKPYRLHRHITCINRDQWDPDCSIRFKVLDGKLILVDGQHRLTALVKTGAAKTFIVVYSDAASEDEIHTVYSRIDVDGNRSIADVLAAADPTAGRDISFETRRNGYWAMEDLANDFPHKKLKVGENDLVTKEDRVVCMTFWLNELEQFDQIVRAGQSSLRKRLRTPGVVAVALATLKHQPMLAPRFWGSVADNKLLRPGDPEQALVNFLLTAKLNDGHRVSERGAVQAWNAWFGNRRLAAIKKDPRNERPIVIAGTPFAGRT